MMRADRRVKTSPRPYILLPTQPPKEEEKKHDFFFLLSIIVFNLRIIAVHLPLLVVACTQHKMYKRINNSADIVYYNKQTNKKWDRNGLDMCL
jgi:hypothetical protein